jgi:AcrR family transcriptional regulator
MTTVSTPYEASGRTRQKARTRDALLRAAQDCIADGRAPTVEAVADRSGVSRTTAYRYFPSQHALLRAAHPETVTTSMLQDDSSSEPDARLDQVIAAFTEMVLRTEEQQRTMLRLSLQRAPASALPLRQGRAIGWIEEALLPLRGTLDDQALRNLVLAIRSATGIEALVWLTDVAGLDRGDARELMRWTAQALLQAAASNPPPAPTTQPAPVRGAAAPSP